MAVAGFIPIDRQDRAAPFSLTRAGVRSELRSSFPEGTRSRDGRLARFKRAFHLALDAGVPVVPVAIAGTFQVIRPRSIIVRPGPVHVTFAPPIEVAAFAGDLDGLMAKVRSEIAAQLPLDQLTQTKEL
jgi:1-acyl-sn-glycerol-3-phosphate acyltransferase